MQAANTLPPVLSGCGNFSSALSVFAGLVWVSLTCAPFRVSRRFGQEFIPIQVEGPPTASCPGHLFLISSCSELEFFQSIKLHRLSSGSCHREQESHRVLPSQHETPTAFSIYFLWVSPSAFRWVLFCFRLRVFTRSWVFSGLILRSSQFDIYNFYRSLVCEQCQKNTFLSSPGSMSLKALELPDEDKIASQSGEW